MKRSILVLVFVMLVSCVTFGQVLTLGDMKLKLGMSKAEVFQQASWIADLRHYRNPPYKTATEMPDGEVITLLA